MNTAERDIERIQAEKRAMIRRLEDQRDPYHEKGAKINDQIVALRIGDRR